MARTKHVSKSTAHAQDEYAPRAEESLGAYIRRVRLMRGLNLPDVARALANEPPSQRISHPYLSQIELGQVFQPARERLQSLANVLQIKPEWLFEKAGLPLQGNVAPPPPRSPVVEQIAARAARMEPTDQKMLLEMIDWVMRQRASEGKGGKAS